MVISHPAEPIDQGIPDAAGRSDVDTIGGVAMQVAQIHKQRTVEITQRQVSVSDFGRNYRLHDSGQGRVAGGDRVVIVEIGQFLVRRELVTLQK